MNKKVITIVVAGFLSLMLVGVSFAQNGPPGSGYWFGATHQNVGTGTATIAVTAYDSASNATYPYTPSPLAAGASINIGPDDIPGLPAGFIGSMVTSSDQPLVALVNVTNRLAGSNGVSGGRAAGIYNGIDGSTASTSVSFPLAKNNHFNKTTTFYLQNAGNAAATIDVTFTFNGTDYNYTTPSVAPGQMVAVDPGLAGVPSGNGQVGAMTLTSAQPIASVMLEHENTASVGTVLQGSSGFSPAELGQTMYCPTYKNNHFGRNSGLQVQNAHAATQDITVDFISSGGATTSVTHSNIAPGASTTFIQPSQISNGLYSAVVRGSLGNVAAIVNESELPLVNSFQTSTTYNCQSSGSTNVSYPAYKEGFFGRTTALQIQNVGASNANVTLTFTNSSGSFSTVNQTIAAGASNVYVCASSTAGLWSGAALGASTLSGVTINSDQPVVAVANEASWATVNPCIPNNGSGSFDKAMSNGFNLSP